MAALLRFTVSELEGLSMLSPERYGSVTIGAHNTGGMAWSADADVGE
jgi:hypothetical protein